MYQVETTCASVKKLIVFSRDDMEAILIIALLGQIDQIDHDLDPLVPNLPL